MSAALSAILLSPEFSYLVVALTLGLGGGGGLALVLGGLLRWRWRL